MFTFNLIQDQAAMLRRRAAAPLKPTKPQAKADHGLFSDDRHQIDLVDELRRIGNIGKAVR